MSFNTVVVDSLLFLFVLTTLRQQQKPLRARASRNDFRTPLQRTRKYSAEQKAKISAQRLSDFHLLNALSDGCALTRA